MRERHRRALAAVITDPRELTRNLDQYAEEEPQPDGSILRSMLAVDR